ncbi:carbohydrate kinase family protein [Nocardiopsis halophila]|uniref:carbohydrate kinase family protein n=1 Tax=Nocardiopsis halophila TaxID=141692 RepID=UPI00034B41CA|nr:carbohydrate kinase family protein [Nocardiopsis halophila]
MSPKIVVAGTANLGVTVPVDGFPLPDGPTRRPPWIRTGVAGVGANVAGTLAGLGATVELCTVIGADLAGDLVRTALRRQGLLGRGAVTGPVSSVSVDLVSGDGRRAGHTHLQGVERAGYPAGLFAEALQGADLAVVTTADFARPLLETARREGVPVATDLHLVSDAAEESRRPWLNSADIVFCSHERLPGGPLEWIGDVFAAYPGCLIAAVGCGADGAALGLRDGTLVRARTEPPRPVRSVVGAGDTLFASFLHAWMTTGRPVEALRGAVLHAAWTTGSAWADTGHLTSEGLEELSRTHPAQVELGRWDRERTA